MKNIQKKAFTLIELLVVIAIIAILAAILFPVFGHAREQARKTSCLSNLKQLGLGLMQYSQDYDEALPMSSDAVGNTFGLRGYGGRMYPYVKSTQIFICPSSKMTDSKINYAGSSNVFRENRMLASFAAPVKTVALLEIYGSNNFDATKPGEFESPRFGTVAAEVDPYYPTVSPGGISRRVATGVLNSNWVDNTPFIDNLDGQHLGGSNYLFFDGHAKWLKGTMVSRGRNANSPNCNQGNNPAIPGCNAGGGDQFQAAGTSGLAKGQPIAATFSVQ